VVSTVILLVIIGVDDDVDNEPRLCGQNDGAVCAAYVVGMLFTAGQVLREL
jgi:hypothetical protein